MRLSTLLIDLDGVLRLWPKEHSALEQAHDLPPGSIAKMAFDPALLEQAITGRITDQEWRSEVSSRLAAFYPSSNSEEGVAAWSKTTGSVHHDVLRLVIRARRHFRVGLLTNATDRLPQDLKILGLGEHFDFVVNSSEVGFSKPSPEIFWRALSIAGSEPTETLFVDDTPSNVLAASALGIQAHYFTSVAGLTVFLQACGLGTDAA
ncbi:MAG: HAD-IA family hydrolase [Xanthomonadales bacterium]|jgi:putative hydrolase of the HAD superfamily|nr:HAD-IA family hydrolase [Xanthomonadales bacterium]